MRALTFAIVIAALILPSMISFAEDVRNLEVQGPDDFQIAQAGFFNPTLIIDPDWILKEPLFQKILGNFYFLVNIVKKARAYWQDLMGIAENIAKPGKFIKVIAADWLDTCVEYPDMPPFLAQFLDFVSGKTIGNYCDPQILKFFLEDYTGGSIQRFDSDGAGIIVSPTNNNFAADRYEAARFLSSVGITKKSLLNAAVKGSQVQARVFTEKLNAAAGTQDALTGLLKVKAIQTDIKSTMLSYAVSQRARKLRGLGFLQTTNSAAINGIFGSEGVAAVSAEESFRQNLFD